MKAFLFRFLFLLFFAIGFFCFSVSLFNPILEATSLIIPYSLSPFDICTKFPTFWYYSKRIYLLLCILSGIILGNSLYYIFFNKINFNKISKPLPPKNKLFLFVGNNAESKSPIFLVEKSLYQNILITGTTGCGKTSSAMYPFCKQLIEYNCLDPNKKIGMLILDVKGNFYKQVLKFAKDSLREDDIVLLELGGLISYNPLDKPDLKPSVLAERLKTILLLFSPNNSDSYWLDKASQILTECIKLCRLYNDNYVTFVEIHKLIFFSNYFYEKINYLRSLFQKNVFNDEQCFDLLSAIEFFETEFNNLDPRVLSIVKSEISRITSMFVSDYSVQKIFCPNKKKCTFTGFSSVLHEGKIVVLNMNLAKYQNLSRFIAAYLKLDFQAEVLSSLEKNVATRTTAFICDEFHEFVTASDSNFFAQSREAKCINIVATQSYSSLLNTLKDATCVRVLVQNLVNKLWYRTDDTFTIEDIQKLLGKEDKEKTSYSISENAKETNFHYITQRFHSLGSNLSESIQTYTQNDFIFDSRFFSQELPTFSCLAFLSDGDIIIPPCKVQMKPYFQFNLDERNF